MVTVGAWERESVLDAIICRVKVGIPREINEGERRVGLRRQLNNLVAAHHHRTGLPHGKIHAELRRLCGGPPSAQATIEQLEERIATVQTL